MERTFQRLSQEAEDRNFLIWEINYLKDWAEERERNIVFLKVEVARNTIKLRISEAELAKMITLPTPDSEHLTMEQTSERMYQQAEVLMLTEHINYLKNKAEENELQLLDLKVDIARKTIKLRISDAESAKMITLPNTRFSFHAYQNYERLCSYINEVKALGNNLETTYLRLRDRLSQHETVDLSEMELRLPARPLHCHRLIILDMKAHVARNIIKLRISQAESAKMITLPNTRTSSHAYQNDERLCSYINEVKALRENLRPTYLRLRDRLRRGETVDLSEMDLRIPDLPQHCRQVPPNI